MVRKWSYLRFQHTQDYLDSTVVTKVKSFRVFRKTTRFKKFTRGITKNVRQKYIKRKFYSNYFILPQITKQWSFNYIQSKQIERFIQSFQQNQIISTMPDYEVFNTVSKPIDKVLNIHVFSCSKNIIYKTNNYFFPHKIPFLKPTSYNSKLSFAQTTTFESLQNNNIFYTLDTHFDNLNYHSENLNSSIINLNIYTKLINVIFEHNLLLTLTIYKILITTTLRNIN